MRLSAHSAATPDWSGGGRSFVRDPMSEGLRQLSAVERTAGGLPSLAILGARIDAHMSDGSFAWLASLLSFKHSLESAKPPVDVSPPVDHQLCDERHVFEPLLPFVLDAAAHALERRYESIDEKLHRLDVLVDRANLDANRLVYEAADVER